MKAYELRISDLDTEARRAGARWQLFACPEVRDLVRVGNDGRFLVLYDGIWPQPAVWCRVLEDGGYDAEPLGEISSLPDDR